MLMLSYGGADVKHRDLNRILKDLGFYLDRQDGEHEIWSNGMISVSVPRHKVPTNGSLRKLRGNNLRLKGK